ncbi:hypothetical protein D0T87_04335 [Bacteroides sp. 51]|nr:hypothetical protein [Bacteroides sp. 51]
MNKRKLTLYSYMEKQTALSHLTQTKPNQKEIKATIYYLFRFHKTVTFTFFRRLFTAGQNKAIQRNSIIILSPTDILTKETLKNTFQLIYSKTYSESSNTTFPILPYL